jgi:hypothetical protein
MSKENAGFISKGKDTGTIETGIIRNIRNITETMVAVGVMTGTTTRIPAVIV